MSSISAQYSKEIDTLRQQLSEATHTINTYEKTKIMQQENLKKAFMKGGKLFQLQFSVLDEYGGDVNSKSF